MQLTLLELVQDMLTATDSENVTTLDETEEAGMCVSIANRAFEAMIYKLRWRHLKKLDTLTSSAFLNEMTVPSGTIAIDPNAIWYSDTLIQYMEPDAFLATTIVRDVSASNIVSSNNVKVYNDRIPSYVTSFNDSSMTFDAYPNSSGLVTNSADIIAWVGPTSRKVADADIFNLPAQAFSALTSKCIAMALNEVKGDTQGSTVSEREHRRQMAALGRNARLVDVRDDLRKYVVARQTLRNTTSNVRRISQ
tara:strand:- start:2097 stop:2846 length:750 start_codon:yes stop_codon:yes gene_type:complete